MKYKVLIDNVNKYTYKNEFIYFETISNLEELRKDLTKLNETKHLTGIVKHFLIKWGRMGRVVGREGLDWKGLCEILRNSEKDFAKLRKEKFQTINLEKESISGSITSIYEKLTLLITWEAQLLSQKLCTYSIQRFLLCGTLILGKNIEIKIGVSRITLRDI